MSSATDDVKIARCNKEVVAKKEAHLRKRLRFIIPFRKPNGIFFSSVQLCMHYLLPNGGSDTMRFLYIAYLGAVTPKMAAPVVSLALSSLIPKMAAPVD